MAESIREVEAPTVEPITLDEAKLELRIDHSDEDQALQRKIIAARQQVEADAQQYVAQATRMLVFDAVPDDGVIVLPFGPLVEVDTLTLFDVDHVETEVDPANYLVDDAGNRVILNLELEADWFPESPRAYNVGALTFVAGPATPPAWAAQAMMLLLRHWKQGGTEKYPAGYLAIIEPRQPVGVA